MSIDRPKIGQCRGFTLIELIVFIVIVSVGLLGLLSVLNVTVRSSADPMVRKQMLAIAEALVEEVAAQPFTYCDSNDANAATANNFLAGGTTPCSTYIENLGPETISSVAETRGGTPAFDNVNDYSGISSANLAWDLSGTHALPAGYSASIAVTATDAMGPAGLQISSNATPATMTLLRIGVTVTHGSQSLTLEGYRSRYAPNATP